MNNKTLSASQMQLPQQDVRKLANQARMAERDAAKARSELRAMKASQETLVAQAQAKSTLLEQQVKKSQAKFKERLDESKQQLAQKDDELRDATVELNDVKHNLAAAQALLEQRGINPISLQPFAKGDSAEHDTERAAFVHQLNALEEILAAREAALVRKIDQMHKINATLETMPTDVAITV